MKLRVVVCTVAILVLSITTLSWSAPDDVAAIQQAIRDQGAHWQAGETPYTNLTLEQKRAMLGLLGPPNQELRKHLPPFPYQVDQVDEEVDWRNRNGHNWVTPIRDQGQCGSCWAFGCAAALESAIMISANAPEYPIDLSEQYLVSCSPGSCNGWYAEGTLQFMQNQGITDEECLPYGATDAILCSDRCDEWMFRLSKVSSWGACNYVTAMKNALNVGPISATFEVFDDFYAYQEGVYQHTWGGSVGWHLICIVGYSDSQNAWICKNSWGPSWGMDGYFLIRMGTNEVHIEEGCDWLLPAQAEYPNVAVGAVAVQDQGTGDGDGVLNPGETVNLLVPIMNAPMTSPANYLSARISTIDSRVTILDADGDYPNLQPGQTVTNNDPFTLSVAANCDLGTIEFTLEVYANDTASPPYFVTREFALDVSLYQPGFPIFGSEADGAPAVCDLNGDGILDIISGDFGGWLKAVNGQGQALPGFPYHIQGFIKSSPAIADLDGDQDLEIVFTGWSGYLHVLNADGTPAITPINLSFFASATPTLGDLDGDQDLEIIVGGWNGKMYAFHHDGEAVTGFPFTVGTNQCIQDGALLLDLNGDQLPEILFGSINHQFYALSGSGQELWHTDLGNTPAGAPVAAEFIPGTTYIVVPDISGIVHYLNLNGQQQMQANLGVPCKCSPAIADLNADGQLEVALNDQNGGVHILNLDGQDLPGFPVQTGAGIWASSSFADIDNDGWLDMVVANFAGNLYVITHTGALMNPFPISLGMGSRSTATIANVDQDTYVEIILGNYNGLTAVDPKLDAGVTGAWNMYRGNLRRTGNYADGSYVGVTPQPGTVAQTPTTYALLPACPNPFNPTTTVSFQLPLAGQVKLQVFDVAGRLVATLLDGVKEIGTHQVAFNGRDLASGLYFVRMQATEGPFGAGKFSSVQKIMLLK
jgi:hypothetical protein